MRIKVPNLLQRIAPSSARRAELHRPSLSSQSSLPSSPQSPASPLFNAFEVPEPPANPWDSGAAPSSPVGQALAPSASDNLSRQSSKSRLEHAETTRRPPPEMAGDVQAMAHLEALATCSPHGEEDAATLAQVRRGSEALVALLRAGHTDAALDAIPQALSFHLMFYKHGRPPLTGYLARLPAPAWQSMSDKLGTHMNFTKLIKQVGRMRALAAAAPPDKREQLLDGLCAGLLTHREIPLDPLGIKRPAGGGTAVPPADPQHLQAFLSSHSLAGPVGAPATAPMDPTTAVLSLMNRAHAAGWGSRYALPHGLRRLLKREEPRTPANVLHNTTGQVVEVRLKADGHRHTLRVRPNERVALPTRNVTKLRVTQPGLVLNPYLENGRLALRPEAQPRALPLLGAGAAGAMPRDSELLVPALVHTVWLGGALPEKYHERVMSFREMNPDHSLVLWTDLTQEQFDHEPSLQATQAFCRDNNIALMSAQRHAGPWLEEAGVSEIYHEYLHHRQYAAASDILRVVLLKHLGGTYADADRTCMQPLHGLRAKELVVGMQANGTTPELNDFFMAKPQHPIFDAMIDQFKKRRVEDFTAEYRSSFSREDEAVIDMTGPGALRRAYFVWSAATLGSQAPTPDVMGLRGPAKEVPPDNVARLLPSNVEQGNSLQMVCNRTCDAVWIDKHRAPKQFVADRSESAATRETRLVSNLLDDVRLFGDVDLGHHPVLQNDPALRAQVVGRLADLLGHKADRRAATLSREE